MKKLITILLITLSFSMYSQDTKKMIEGKEYIVHTVQKKETLYRLSKKYNVSKKEIREANPGLGWFTKTGQVLHIPTGFTTENIHTVKRGETLYGISRKYGISIEELTRLNPEKIKSISVGDKLILPKDKTKNSVEEDDSEIMDGGISLKNRDLDKGRTVSNTIKGNKIHVVKAGETMYGIARAYGVPFATLSKLNPNVDGISVGDKIIVPKMKNARVVEKIETKELKREVTLNVDEVQLEKGKIIKYTVQKGETFYGISRKFKTSVSAIQKLNSGVTTLKEGDVINIPVSENYKETKITLGEPIEIDNANWKETHKINPLKEKLENLVKKETYKMTLFLPFMLDKNETYQTKPQNTRKIYGLTEMSTHFFQGVQLALDSAKESGISVELTVLDTKKDVKEVKKMLLSNDVKNADLIIGPFYEDSYKIVANFAKLNKMQVVCPVSRQSSKIFLNNPYVTELKTSLPTQISYLANYIGNKRNTENVICVSGKTQKDKFLAGMFTKEYKKVVESKSNNYRPTAKTYKMSSYSDMKKFDVNLVKNKKNIIVIPFTELGMATSFFTQLNMQLSKRRMRGYEIEIYALENFMEYRNIDIDFKLKYNLHVTTCSFIDYNDEAVKKFVLKYREKYGTEPTKYAFMGFDAAFFHAITMNNFGKNYTNFYGNVQVPLLQTNYNLKRTYLNSGFENQKVILLKYVDYELVKVE